MTREAKENIFLIGFLSTAAIIIIPLYTFWFGTQQNPFNYTLSMIGNRFDRMTEFIIWGIVTGLLLVFYISTLFKRASYKDKRSRRLLIYSHIFLVLTCVTPAIEEVNAFTHKLHALFGTLFAVSLCLSLYFFIRFLRLRHEQIASKITYYFLFVVLGSVLMMVVFGNSGIFELFFFLTLSVLLFLLKKWIR